MEVRLLGQLEAVADDGSVIAVRGVKLRSLVAILALHRGEPVGADRLIADLWGDVPPGNPTNALQATVSQLRRAFGASKIVTSDAGYALAIAPDDLDIVRFERLVAEGRRQLVAGDPSAASRTLQAALAICRDEALVEFAYAEFALGERARLDELALAAVEARIEADLALGRHGDVVGELEGLCQRHPLRERLWELLMLALYRAGRQADALRAFGEARTALVEELGLDPGSGLKELEARVLAQDPTLDAPLDDRRQAVSTGSVGNLRAPLTTFVGRDDDLARLVQVTRTRRLVTLIGPGGAGKTRLAVETVATLQPEYQDGAWLVELAAVRDPEAIAGAIAAAADFADQACGGPAHDDPSIRVAAQAAAAAVAAVGSGSEGDIERFAALVRRRNGIEAGRFAAASVGTVGSTLDEPDVAALCRTLGFESVSRRKIRRSVCFRRRVAAFGADRTGELSGTSAAVQRVDGC